MVVTLGVAIVAGICAVVGAGISAYGSVKVADATKNNAKVAAEIAAADRKAALELAVQQQKAAETGMVGAAVKSYLDAENAEDTTESVKKIVIYIVCALVAIVFIVKMSKK
jgi:hypothetical protein